jgi:hypothetical protein
MDDVASVRRRLDSNQGDTKSDPSLRTAPFDRLLPVLNDANLAVQQLLEAAYEAGRVAGVSEGHNGMRAKLLSLLDLDCTRHKEPQHSLPSEEYDRSLQSDTIVAPAGNERIVQWTTRLPS